MSTNELNRRRFLQQTAAGVGAMALLGQGASALDDTREVPRIGAQPYRGPNVVIIRFGGGVRRRETIDPQNTYAPYFLHKFAKRGTLYTNMEISEFKGVDTSHGQGTLYILTGKYNSFKNVSTHFLGERFESHVPTVFEYFRKEYDVPEYQTLIVNGEDRTDEEFYSFSNHHLFGVNYRSNVLSLYRFKVYLLQQQIESGNFAGKQLEKKLKELRELEKIDHRVTGPEAQAPEIQAFWARWREFYGDSGFVNPRGDQLLAELAVRAIRELRPKLLMVNFNDPDYVHWGNPVHYTRGISVIDQAIERIVATVEGDDEYRGNTIFVIAPDCGRDNNMLMDVPYQHHFNTKSSHEIFALLMGPGIAAGQVVDHSVDQIQIASTVGKMMQFQTTHTESAILEEAFA